MDNRPIGLLDSGVGGLTVARELLRQLPNEEIVYIGDTRRAPYGPRSREQIIAFTWDMVNFLLSKDVKMIVMACNTATAMALEIVKEKLDIPVIGVILPGASSAIQKTKTNKIGVIATQASIRSDEYHKTIAHILPKLSEEFLFSVQKKADNSHTVIRLVTSWATREEEAHRFVRLLKSLSGLKS